MVYYYTSKVVDPSAFIYVGKDKFENEDLIKHGLEKDRADALHLGVYLVGSTSITCPVPTYIFASGKLTKANSIEGNKKDNITVIYTPWSNLLKDGSMATGQVTFHNHKMVRKVLVRQRENPIVNRLNKTRIEKFPDLKAEKDEYLKKKQKEERKVREEQRSREKQERREREQLKWQKDHAYDDLMSEENVQASNNQDRDPDFLDDFM
ncbi:hypothetical protein CBS63078_10585 [Aspergillus niger]|nr:hypothetical protein CBS115989_5720 [Aspergillus niger]KAI2819858.1 hypothetical protein CBS133816_9956 [Aspergillus niger]KAI2840727.1 hypothetical protein CBS11350_6746 [Aspergillus niger]KAI2851116.1 hypothetical protein CBS12448_8578 [Aspergillus niger]KAI2857880.1 hypothetical protein CBS11232_2892 [Aspergillus niger]